MNATKSVFNHQEQIWIKSNNNNKSKLFDVITGGNHDALVVDGRFIHTRWYKNKLNRITVGICKDDVLIAIEKKVDQRLQNSRRKCTNMQTK